MFQKGKKNNVKPRLFTAMPREVAESHIRGKIVNNSG